MANVNSLIDAVCTSIYNEFGDDYTIYTHEVKQGLKEPCFFVFCENPMINIDFGLRYIRNNTFAIQYLSKDEEKHSVFERLFNALELIDVDGKLYRGSGFSAQTVDDVLTMTCSYDGFEYRTPNDIDVMETLQQEGDVR